MTFNYTLRVANKIRTPKRIAPDPTSVTARFSAFFRLSGEYVSLEEKMDFLNWTKPTDDP